MPINKFYVNFAISFGPFKPTKGIKRNQKYAHRFPQFNFEILTNVIYLTLVYVNIKKKH